MKDISFQCGLPISISEEDGRIYSNSQELIIPKEGKRTFDQIREVTTESIGEHQNDFAYLVYRNIFMRGDSGMFLSSPLRYNLIVLPPGLIGKEYIKTLGHFHSLKPGTTVVYPEIYEIVLGEAIFLIQKMDAAFQTVSEHYIFTCKQGEKIIIPPGFGHTTINATKDMLIMGNVMTTDNNPNYEPYRQFKGASHAIVQANNGALSIEQNPRLTQTAPLKKISVKALEYLNIPTGEKLYPLVTKSPQIFSFIINPEQFQNELSVNQLFTL